jgi:hypothetical protein
MVKVYIEDNELFGPVVVDIKGLRKGSETICKVIEQSLRYTVDGLLSVDWQSADLPTSLKRRLVIVQ